MNAWRQAAAPLAVAIGLCGISAVPVHAQPSAVLSPVDQAAGWKLLFDGQSTAAWRAYRGQVFPTKGWSVADGCLKLAADGGGGDIVTVDQFGDVEFMVEWRATAKANSGIIYRATEEFDAPWQTGPEYQILDDAGAGEAADSKHSAGAMFDLCAPAAGKVLKPAGEWNLARVRIHNGVVQHFLNGTKVVDCPIVGDAWKQCIAGSKFREYAGFGVQPRGHIALQDHGNEVWFRNMRVRDLSAAPPGEVRLFNGKDLAGWKAVLPDGTRPEDTWSVQDGILICKGQPVGYIRTEQEYTNYILKLEWRFSPVTRQAGNSGVLLRMVGADKVWPRCVEAQLQSGNAGDFWNIDEFPMKAAPERTEGRNTKKLRAAERPVGEWNEYEIVVNGPRIALFVNGELLNEAWDVHETPGKIGLQSEGAEIHFRNVRLVPLGK
jgi:hypothetical protein